jgi:hypothetical protein
MAGDPTENTPWREGENYDEMVSEEPFDEEELDAEEAEQRITQFITSADELPGPPVEELAEQVVALMLAALGDLETLMDGKPTTRYSLRNCCLASELANCTSTTHNSGTCARQALYLVG